MTSCRARGVARRARCGIRSDVSSAASPTHGRDEGPREDRATAGPRPGSRMSTPKTIPEGWKWGDCLVPNRGAMTITSNQWVDCANPVRRAILMHCSVRGAARWCGLMASWIPYRGMIFYHIELTKKFYYCVAQKPLADSCPRALAWNRHEAAAPAPRRRRRTGPGPTHPSQARRRRRAIPDGDVA